MPREPPGRRGQQRTGTLPARTVERAAPPARAYVLPHNVFDAAASPAESYFSERVVLLLVAGVRADIVFHP